MKKSEALSRLKDGDVEGARFIVEYFNRRNGIPANDPAIYRFVRRKTGVTKDEWEALVKQL